jgi:predicted membrane protein
MDSDFKKDAQKILLWLKVRIKYIAAILLVIIALSMGFIVMVTAILLIPVAQWLLKKKMKKFEQEIKKTTKKEDSDFIDVEYTVVEEKKDKK